MSGTRPWGTGGRRAGLSKKESVASLLSTFRKETDVDAPPLDDSESDGLPSKGEIRPSSFLPPLSPTGTRRTNKDHRETPRRSPRTRSPKDVGRTSRRNNRTLEKPTKKESSDEADKGEGEKLGAHFDDNFERSIELNQPSSKARYKRQTTFRSSKSSKSSASLPTKFLKTTGGLKNGKEEESSPEKGCKSSDKKLKVPGELLAEDTPPRGKRRLRVPVKEPSSTSDSPHKDKRTLKLPPGELPPTADSSPKRKRKLQLPDKDVSSISDTPVKSKGERESKRGRTGTASPEERPALKIPGLVSSSFNVVEDDALSNDDGQLVPPFTRRSTSPLSEVTTPTSSRPICPMCDEVVDRRLLDEFKAGAGRMTLQQEQKFCILHKKTSAKAAWAEKGYPDIRWSSLEARINQQHGFLRAILEGGKSHYGDIFSEKVKTGQNKTLLKSEENLTPGYYGIRGLRAMSENLVREFSTLLRKRAVEDRLVSARGHTAYVQSVLVPELTVRLIMDDMDVDQEEARVIMTESRWVGELLSEELADIVLSEDDESDSELSS
ncbi:RTC4-like domain-containing protein [Cercophora newfieldiana]|uniref:Restriction of telomere capping protein 4 n=1 Tax=Cercophora newfieldiana TaxID=92897 RepID=A0AA39YRB0_9PEZI|nr:RTC4-like domain-containing protein [Cercophora newfieldiana]